MISCSAAARSKGREATQKQLSHVAQSLGDHTGDEANDESDDSDQIEHRAHRWCGRINANEPEQKRHIAGGIVVRMHGHLGQQINALMNEHAVGY